MYSTCGECLFSSNRVSILVHVDDVFVIVKQKELTHFEDLVQQHSFYTSSTINEQTDFLRFEEVKKVITGINTSTSVD